ncbi:MAG: alpha-amlyase [Chitinophagaceae bacterium]|nr:MAG: alpha-amlyase [Chitinophagaceae bacterium]
MFRLLLLLCLLSTLVVSAQKPDRYSPKPYVELRHPEWSRNAVLYQVNIRQYTAEGTFKAFAAHLPRLKALGVDILWLMPIQPIGVEKRKGTLGSEYSVRDYYGVNPEFGSMQEFKDLVKAVHAQGMHLILDWVANHSAWDNPLAKQHPDWYTHTGEGAFQPTPWYDWDDVIDFDYDKPALRRYMTDALKWLVKETGIDGYRCDVAGFIPLDFWDNVRKELDAIKPVFLLAEWEARDMHKRAFDATYSWSLYETLRRVRKEEPGAFPALVEYLAHDVNTWPDDAYRMLFTDNHDKNSWTGTPFTQFGPALEACIAFTYVCKGIPLIYNGQEAGSDKMLRFFDKDTIQWKAHRFDTLYSELNYLKHRSKLLANGAAGGQMLRVRTSNSDKVVAFARMKDDEEVLAVFNFSAQRVQVKMELLPGMKRGTYALLHPKTYAIPGMDASATLDRDDVTIWLEPWQWEIYWR